MTPLPPSNGHKMRLMTPGPTPVPEETLLDLARPVFFHHSAEFKQVFTEVNEGLQYVFRTKNPVLTLTCSGTGGMEAAISNLMPPGSKAILLVAGRWGERWKNLCKAFGVEAITVAVPYGQAVSPDALTRALAAHPDALAVFATLSETSTGVACDIAAYGELLRPTGKLFVVDAISGLGVMECQTDAWGIDVCVTGSQKALMLPPGLAYLSVSERAFAQMDKTQARLFYFDLRKYRDKLKDGETPFTPANTLIRAQRISLQRIRAEGIENVWARHARLGAAARAGVAALGLELFAERPADGLTVFKVPMGIDGNLLLSKLDRQYGLRLGNGQDNLKGKIVRLSHMGYADTFDVLAALSGVELVLKEMGYPLTPGAGVAAAQRVFVDAIR